MRCLYCGKELALLKRLTGGGEFCSEAHKQSYQEEYNRLALSRLLQAQAKGGESKATQHASEGPKPAAPVAVAEVVVEEPEVEQVDELEPVEQEEQEEQEEAVPEQIGFLLDKPDFVAIDDEPPYEESWSDSPTAAPAIPEWQFQNALSTLSLAALVPLEIHPEAWQPDYRGPENKVRPKEFTSAKVELNVPLTVTLNHEFPTAGPIPLNISSKTGNSPATVIRTALNFREQVLSLQSALLEPLSAGIEFPGEEDSVSIPGEWFDEGAVVVEDGASESDATPASTSSEQEPEPESQPEPEPTPRSALQALSRLHKDLLQDEEPEPAPAMARPSSGAVRVSVVHSLPEESLPQTEPELVAVAVAPVVDITPVEEKAPEPVQEESKPPVILEFVEIPLNAFPPAKANQVSELDAVQQAGPLLPRLKGLPLRPKVALAPAGFGAPAKAATAKIPAPAPEPKAKAAATAAVVEPENRRPSISEKIAPTVPRKPATAPASANASAPAEKPPNAAPAVPKPAKPIVREPVRKPVAAPAAAATPPPEPPAPKPPLRKPEEQPTLTFEALEFQLMSTPTPTFWSSLKSKLIIAIVLVMGGVGAYMYLGSRSKPPVGDGSGPSIMVGEGGWVQNWAGDPSGMHVGREITFYRPSLKLSDYRIEFQAQIETKSAGWVFRASDPNNYYAMKIAILGTGLPMKVALFKYIVHNGHETEVGRVGIDTPIAPDSAINVRVDVRGAKFSTSVQGTPVDVWTDDQLKSGGVGFLNERGERARVKTVSISYLTGGTK